MKDYALTNHGSNKTLLTLSQVRDWEREILELANQRRDIERRMYEIDRRLMAAKFFMDEESLVDTDHAEGDAAAPSADRESLPDAITRILKEAGKSLTTIEIRRILDRDPVHAARFKNSPNYLYTAMGRLKGRGTVKRRGTKYSLPSEQNEAPPDQSGGASKVAGEVAASPVESRDRQADFLG